MVLASGVLLLFGMLSIRAYSEGEATKQFIFMLFGLAVAMAVQTVNYRTLLVMSPVLFAISLLPVLYTIAGRYVTVPFVKREGINGAWAWINFGPVSFQPSELTKICLIMLLAWTLRG